MPTGELKPSSRAPRPVPSASPFHISVGRAAGVDELRMAAACMGTGMKGVARWGIADMLERRPREARWLGFCLGGLDELVSTRRREPSEIGRARAGSGEELGVARS